MAHFKANDTCFQMANVVFGQNSFETVKIMGKHKHKNFISEGSTEAIFMMFGLF